MDLHESDDDYAVIFDHHEDVMTLDCERNPTAIVGYQVKTKEQGRYTISALLKRDAAANESKKSLLSIIGKLYDLKMRFPAEVHLLAVICNQPISVRLKCDGKTHRDQKLTTFADLVLCDQQAIATALQTEFELGEPPDLNALLEFRQADLPLHGHDIYAKGRLANFLEQLYPNKEFRIVPLFRALLGEVASRNNNHDTYLDYDSFLQRKALTKHSFSRILEHAGISDKSIDVGIAMERLNAENAPFPLVRAVQREWDGVMLDRLSNRDLAYLRMSDLLSTAVQEYLTEARLIDLVEKAYAKTLPCLKREWSFSEGYIKTLIILHAYECQ